MIGDYTYHLNEQFLIEPHLATELGNGDAGDIDWLHRHLDFRFAG